MTFLRFVALGFAWVCAAAAGSVPPPVLPSGFVLEHVVPGVFIGEPTGFAFLPDERVLVIERDTGVIRLVVRGGSQAVAIHQVADSDGSSGERGLLGIAVDPAWPARPYVYCYHTHLSLKGHITRLTATGELADPESPALELGDAYKVFVEGPAFAPWHHGGSIRFGREGLLYLSLGDNLSSCAAQSLGSLVGVILRLDVSSLPPGPGGPAPVEAIIPPDNLVRGPSPLRRLVWAWGLRNPFRFTVDRLTGDLFVGDVGESRWEEVDRVPFGEARVWNFGWPQREGPDPTLSGEDCGDGEIFTDPVFAYAHDVETSSAIICGPVYRRPPGVPDAPPHFPPEYEGNLFVIDHSNGVMRRLRPDSATWVLAPPVAGQPSPEGWATGVYSISDFQQGPDGALWLAKRDSSTWGLWRIARAAATAAPRIATPSAARTLLHVRPNPARRGRVVTFSWPREADASEVLVVDVAGRAVRTLPAARASFVTWDGCGSDGRWVAAGTYVARLGGHGRPIATARIVLRD